MMLRLKLYRLSLKLAIYALPILAFWLGWWLWTWLCASFGRPILYPSHGHLIDILFAMFVWAFVAGQYKVTSFDELFRERTGIRAAGSACIATSFVLLATLYFSRNDVFPRALLVCDVITLLFITVLVHAVFRIVFRAQSHTAKPTRLLVVGAD